MTEGAQLGIGVFETMGVFDERLSLWGLHMQRMARGAQRLGIPFAPPARLEHHAHASLERHGHDVLRLVLDAGEPPRWTMTTRRREPVEVVRLHVAQARRSPSDPTVSIKCTSRAFLHLAREEARAAGCDDALVLDTEGRVGEATYANVFFVRDGVWHTPDGPDRCLPGIARQVLLEELARDGCSVERGDYELDDLLHSDAIFVTNAVYGPRPATLSGGPPASADNPLAAAWRQALECR